MVNVIKKNIKRVFNFPAHLAKKHLYRRPLEKLNFNGGVVSFSFDDFPKSAATTGRELLEKYQLKGTFFTSYSLMGAKEYGKQMYGEDELKLVYENGHEIGCHTSTHIDCSKERGSKIFKDIQTNKSQLESLLEGLEITSFAYPKGRSGVTSKKLINNFYSLSRTTKGGLNYSRTSDANLLNAVAVYDKNYELKYYQRLIDEVKQSHGWIIFYTHDVESVPSEFGCKPNQLEEIIKYSIDSKVRIVPLKDAIRGQL